jgi:hypothetical protein
MEVWILLLMYVVFAIAYNIVNKQEEKDKEEYANKDKTLD